MRSNQPARAAESCERSDGRCPHPQMCEEYGCAQEKARLLGQVPEGEAELAVPAETAQRLLEAIRGLDHSFKPGIAHRIDNPRPDGTFVTPGEERPHEPWCVPCSLLGLVDPALDLREQED